MKDRTSSWAVRLALGVLLLGSIALAGCSMEEMPDVGGLLTTPTPRPAVPTATRPVERPTPSPTTTLEPVSTSITLTVWAPEHLAPGGETAGGQVLAQQVQAFNDDHSNVGVEYQLKKPYGKGGVLDFLLVTSEVVPANLPDLVVLDVTELNRAARAGALQPLGDELSTVVADLFPFAQQAGRYDGQNVAIPFEVDVEHLALAQTAPEPEPAPLTWTDVLTRETTYVFPAGGREKKINDAFLIQYLALGGRWVDTSGNPTLEEEKVAEALAFYRQGRQQGVIPERVSELSSLGESWSDVTSGAAAMGHVNSQQFLADREGLEGIAFGPIPTKGGTPITMARGWAYAVVTRESRRQEAAVEFLSWLLQPSNLAEWTRSSHHLPTRRSAFAEAEDPYWLFVMDQLETARAGPPAQIYDVIAGPLQTAVRAVLSGAATPEEAAATAVEAIR